VVSSKRPNSSVSVFEIASASLAVKMRNWQWRRTDVTVLELLRLKGGERSGLTARSTHRYRYPALSSHR
jgi:hypothetical protein